MQNGFLFLSLMVILAAVNLWLGKRASKQTKTEDDFYLSGRNLGLIPLILTILATQLGGGTVLGAAEEAYHRGWIVILYPLGTTIGLFLVALGFGAKLRKMELTTIPELFEKIYQSKQLRHVCSLFSVVSLFVILVAQGIAARKFFSAVGFTEPWIFTSFWMILVIYTLMGGLSAVVNTDIVQVLFIVASFTVAFIVSMFTSFGPEVAVTTTFNTTNVPWVGWLLMPLMFMFIEQDMAQRYFAARTPRYVTIGTLCAGLTLLLFTLVPIYFGVMAAKSGILIPDGTSVLLSAISTMTHPLVFTFVTVAILMAVISTADTLLCSISSNVSYDFKFFHHKNVRWAQGVTFAIGVLSLLASYTFSNVVSVLIFSYELSVSAFFAPVLMAIYGKSPSKVGAYCAIIGGISGFVIFHLYPVWVPREVMTQLMAFGGYFFGQFLARKEFALCHR